VGWIFGGFAERALTAGRRGAQQRQAMLSERELTVLGLLPSMLSLDEIADDLGKLRKAGRAPVGATQRLVELGL
jgi:hypothetical protein